MPGLCCVLSGGCLLKGTVIHLIEVQGSLIETFNKGATLDTTASDPQDISVDKDKFDAVLRKIINTKPLPLKDVVGTSPRGKRAEPASPSAVTQKRPYVITSKPAIENDLRH